MLLHSVGSVLPLLLLIALGFCIAPLPWCGRPGMHLLSKLNMDIAIPPYLFYTVARMYSNTDELLAMLADMKYPLLLTVIGMALAVPAAKLLRILPPQRGVFVNAVTLSNTVLMGMPVTIALFGDQALPIAMIFYSANTIIFWTAGVWLLRRETGKTGSTGFLTGVIRVLLSRPLTGFLVGILWVVAGLPLPDFLARTCSMLGQVVTPVSMLFIGCVIRFSNFSAPPHLRELLCIIGYRYTIVPLLTLAVCWYLPVAPLVKKVFFILSNMPVMAQLPIVAEDVGSDYETASMATATTTALSMAAIPVYMLIMEHGGLFD